MAFRRAHLAAALVALLWAVPLLVTARCGRVLLKQDFNKYRGKRYAVWTQAQARSDFAVSGGSRPSADGVSRKPGPYNLALVRNAKVGYGHLKVYFRKGCAGLTRGCGLVMSVRLPKPVRSATLSYRVRFSNGYDWTWGGKLPGLCSEECPGGCVPADGSFSSRVMWRRGGRLVSYLYNPGKRNTCGDDKRWSARASSTRWQRIRIYVKVDDPGKANGVQRAWVDGRKVYDNGGLNLRTDNTLIENFMLQVFHGGRPDDARFQPNRGQSIRLDDVKMNEGECKP